MDDSFGSDDDFFALMDGVDEACLGISQPHSNKKKLSLKCKVKESPMKSSLVKSGNQRNGWITSAFDFDSGIIQTKCSKKMKFNTFKDISPKKTAPLGAVNRDDQSSSEEDWVHKYAPKSREELAVHVKKADEVSNWLMSHLKGGLLLLTGPPGAGKTATIRTLCSIGYRNQPIKLQEWSNEIMINSSRDKFVDSMKDEVHQLEDFIFRADRYSLGDVGSPNAHKALLIEELPLQFSQDPQPLQSLLQRHSKGGHCPLILILSDTPSYEFSERYLLPKDVQQKLGITNIHFNPVSNTLLSKSISRIAKLQSRNSRVKMPSKCALDDLASECQGDIRSAVNHLQFLMARGDGKQKGESKSSNSRDSTMILFHALGKILYSKRLSEDSSEYALHKSTLPELPDSLQHIRRPPTTFNPEEVIEQSRLPPPIFTEFVHENAPDFLSSVEQLSLFHDYLSFSDAYCSQWFVDNDLSQIYSGSLGARAFMWASVSKDNSTVTRRWRPLKRPQIGSVRRSIQSNYCQLRSLLESQSNQISSMSHQEAITDYLPFLSKNRSITSTWSRRDRDLLLSMCLFKRNHQQQANWLNDGEWGFCENGPVEDDSNRIGDNRNPFKAPQSNSDDLWEYCREEESSSAASRVIIDNDSD